MKYLLAVCLLLVLGFGCERDTGDAEQRVVRVNGTWLMRDDIEQVVAVLREQLRSSRPEEVLFGGDDMRRRAAQELIINQLMLEKARDDGIVVADSVIDSAFEMLEKRFGPERFKQQMAMNGQTEADVRRYVREGMTIDSLLKIVLELDSVTDAQCRA
ncbi:MAG: hypothetical protein GF331_06220, partial [Chitinivibrionales bacterium]|nr:hypothetical protein [Chitinivibrionales bacterium]